MTRIEQIRNAARYKYQDERIHFIDGAKWADSHPHWIPIEERLPEEGQVVFIYTKHGSVSSVTYKDGAFNLNEVLEAINVTHWMPIVPPRKEE